MTNEREEVLGALGITAGAAMDTAIGKLGEAVKKAHDLTDPEMLDLLVRGADRELDERFRVADVDVLDRNARARILESAKSKWHKEQAEVQRAAERAVALLEAETEARLATQRVLTGESDQPADNRTERLLAQMLDVAAEDAAERWVFDRTPEQVLARYQAATDDGAERAFVRVVERRYAAKVLDLTASKNPMAMATAYSDAITARQDARRSAKDLALLDTLRKMRVDLDRSAMAARPTAGNVARGLSRVAQTGHLPRKAS